MRTSRASSHDLGEAGESLVHVELVLGSFVGQAVKFRLVGLQLLDEVDEVARLLKLVQIFGVDQIAKLVLDADHKLNSVEGVKSVVAEQRVHGDRSLFSCTEIVAHNRKNVRLDFVLA